MLDIRLLREKPEWVAERVGHRGADVAETVKEILACDETRRAGETEKQKLQSDRNRISKSIGALKKEGKDTSEVEAEVRAIGERIKTIGEEADAAENKQRDLLLGLPNLPHDDCPIGEDEDANPEVRVWGDQPAFDFEPKNHIELGESLGLFNFEWGAKISGSNFVVFTGLGAKLERALIQYLLDTHTQKHSYQEVSPPFLINRASMYGTGQLPKFEDDMYGVDENEMFLAPTAEVPVTNLFADTILKEDELPVKVTAYTPCFRKEAGSAGRESRGLIRMHQFDKVELVNVVKPEDSAAQLETLTAEAEAILQALGLHYRVIELCTGDLGFSSSKTYDIEIWAPGHGGYLEVSSCSNFVDYQARRMKLRYKNADGKNQLCHTLNGSGTALPRLVVAFLETYQQADGSVRIPEALQPYMGCEVIQGK